MTWDMAASMGYIPLTTFWDEFTLAEAFGVDGIQYTYDKIFKKCKADYKYLTELVMVLNHKVWYWNGKTNRWGQVPAMTDKIATLYLNLWRKADRYACDSLQGGELQYFYSVTD